MLLLQLLHRHPHRRFKSLRLPHQPWSRFRPLAFHSHQSIPRHQSPRDLQQMSRRRLQILRIRRIGNPNPVRRLPCLKGIVVIPNRDGAAVRNLLSAALATAAVGTLGARY